MYQNLIQSAQALVQAILAFDLKFDNGLNNVSEMKCYPWGWLYRRLIHPRRNTQ